MEIPKKKSGTSHEAQIKHLRRIEGQVRGVTKMIEDNRYCVDVLVQLKAIKSSVATIERKIMNAHINHCVHEAVQSKNSTDIKVVMDEIKTLLKNANF